jgi:hypothetical protein
MAEPPPNPGTHWQRFSLLYGALAIAVLLVLFFFPSDEKAVSRPLLAIARPAPGASLAATLQSNMLRDSRGDTITFEAAADPGTRIDHMVACVQAPGFTSDPASGCVPVTVYNKADIASQPTPATLHLTPVKTSGSVLILVTASWVRLAPVRVAPRAQQAGTGATAAGPPAIGTAATGNPPPNPPACDSTPAACSLIAEKVALSLGPVDLGIDRLIRFGGRFSRFLKDLTLPIILIVLANWLTSVSAERDRKREASEAALREEKERKQEQEEERQRRLEREQEEEKQIAHILLPKVMRLAGHFYLPLTLNAINFVNPSGPGRGSAEELSFCLCSFFLVARSLKEKEGGVFFKDMAAEQMFALANNIIRGLVVSAVGDENQFTACLDFLDSWVPEGQRRWPRSAERREDAPESWTRLEAWILSLKDPQFQAMRFLFNILAGVIRYESNAPYSYWYSNSSAQNLFKLLENIPAPPDDVFGAESAGDMKEFQQMLAAYRQGKE